MSRCYNQQCRANVTELCFYCHRCGTMTYFGRVRRRETAHEIARITRTPMDRPLHHRATYEEIQKTLGELHKTSGRSIGGILKSLFVPKDAIVLVGPKPADPTRRRQFGVITDIGDEQR